MVYPEGLEPPTSWSVAKHSIQLSYGYTRELKSIAMVRSRDKRLAFYSDRFGGQGTNPLVRRM